jgi:hypothetical protein
MQPMDYGRFWDMTVERVEPAGPAMVGQKFVWSSRAMCRRWHINGEIEELDAQRHHIQFRLTLPLGLTSTNRVMCARIDERSCTLRYG